MKRTEHKGYIIDTDDLGRPYIYNTSSPYSEDSDHILVRAENVKEAKAIIDVRTETGRDIRSLEFDQRAYVDQYQRDNIVRVVVKLNRKTDADILAQLDRQQNRQGYIKQLMREDIKRREN